MELLYKFRMSIFNRLRENWAMRVESIRDRLDKVIHKLADKENKSKDDEDLEKSLIGKKLIFDAIKYKVVFR